MDMNILFIILAAIIIDLVFGELPSQIHPVVIMGKFIDIFKGFLTKHNSKLAGAIFTILMIVVFVTAFFMIIQLFTFNYLIYLLISAIILSTTFAIKVLLNSAEHVKNDLNQDIETARKSVSYLVSRDTSELSSEELVSATVESLTENITDSVVSPIFYTFIFGVLGGVTCRVINTLDAMVGYKNPENIKIGWFPAKLDDIMNYIPARVTGILVTLAALLLRFDWKSSYKIMMRDARRTPSPNSGYPMAAAAGALGIKLKKIGCYEIGDSINPLNPDKITEALLLTKITIILFVVLASVLFGIFLTIAELLI